MDSEIMLSEVAGSVHDVADRFSIATLYSKLSGFKLSPTATTITTFIVLNLAPPFHYHCHYYYTSLDFLFLRYH